MTSLMPLALPGWPIPGIIESKYKFSYITNRPYGYKAKHEEFKPQPPIKPRSLGDERHVQLLNAIKNISVTQQTSQITEALPEKRPWR